MEIVNRPELTHLLVGDSLKTMQIKAMAGMGMPTHHNTHEAVIIVQEGRALLKTKDTEYILEKGSSFLIPAYTEHKLEILKNLKAVAIMAIDSNIHFKS